MRHQVLLAGTLLLAISACKPGDKTAKSEADTTAVAAGPNVVTFHAKDFAFEGPAEIPAGMTTIKMVNDGPNLHHIDLVRLDSGKTMADFEHALTLPDVPPSWAVFVGGPNAPNPGDTANATLDLKPGNYAMICFVDIPGGVPHFAKGMISPLTVTAATGPAVAAPKPDITILLSDYTFLFDTPLTAGTHVFEVKDAASQPHELELIKLAPGKTMDDMMKWITKPAGPPPASAVGGVATFSEGSVYFTANITPGNYGLICFVTDAKDGKPHYMHGMTETITVM